MVMRLPPAGHDGAARSSGSRGTAGCRRSGAPRPGRRCTRPARGRCGRSGRAGRAAGGRRRRRPGPGRRSSATPRPRGGGRHQLHQPLRAGRADGLRVEAGLLLGDGGEQVGVDAVLGAPRAWKRSAYGVPAATGAARPLTPETARGARERLGEDPADRRRGCVGTSTIAHVEPGARRLDHLAVADVDRDVVDADVAAGVVPGDQVAGLGLGHARHRRGRRGPGRRRRRGRS